MLESDWELVDTVAHDESLAQTEQLIEREQDNEVAKSVQERIADTFGVLQAPDDVQNRHSSLQIQAQEEKTELQVRVSDKDDESIESPERVQDESIESPKGVQDESIESPEGVQDESI